MPCIGKYRLLGMLGRGGTGSVYRAADPKDNRLKALKILRPSRIMLELAGLDELKRRFHAEAAAMVKLRNEHVADVFETGEHNGLPYMVQEYLCLNLGLVIGESARVELPTRVQSPLKALRIVSQILDALNALHEAGLVHRDIKPENIMMNRAGKVKIIDFGLCTSADHQDFVLPGMILGSPYYAAPEQTENPGSPDRRLDIYSTGVVLYRMVTGLLPEVQEHSVFRNPLLGRTWEIVLKKALAPKPEHRFQDADAMGGALLELKSDWEKRQEQVCALPDSFREDLPGNDNHDPGHPQEAEEKGPAELDNLSSLMQPLVYTRNKFQRTPQGIMDQATGLMWALDLSADGLTLEQARQYTDSLNPSKGSHALVGSWRMPCVQELITLVHPRQSLDDFCGPDLWRFKDRSWLWSSDVKSRSRSWIVDMDQGAVMSQDRMCRFHVLPVCTVPGVMPR